MAQTLKFGNKVWAAKEESVLAYNDINNNYKPLPFTFSRASTGTRVNKDGLIETMGQDIARIDYTDSADGVLLLEPSSTNLISYSSDLSVLSKVSVGNASAPVTTANYALAPDGTMTATRVVFDLNGGTSVSDRSILRQAIASGNYYFSIYVKSTNGTEQKVMWHDGGEYNTTTVTNEWVRITYDARPNSTFGGIALNPTSGVDTSDILAWGFQVEALSYPTSYIPTSGSTVTRAAETCNNSGNSEVFNDSEGVLFADISSLGDSQIYKLISISDGTNNNRVTLGYNNSAVNKFYFQLKANSSSLWQELIVKDINVSKIAFKYKSGQQSVFVNGFEVVNKTNSFTFSSNLKYLSFFEQTTTNPFYGKTKELGYYNTILTDLELETLTSYRNWVSMVNELNLNIIYNG